MPVRLKTERSTFDDDDSDAANASTLVDEDPTSPAGVPLSFTRGLNTRASLSWLKRTHGDDGVARVRAALPAHVVEALGGPSLRPSALSWVPFMAQAQFLDAIARVHYGGDYACLLVLGRAAARHDLPALTRVIARALTPGIFVDVATRLWNVYHTHGRWEVLRGEREVKALLFDRPERHAAFCAATRGWLEGALEFAGAIDANVLEERCAARGAPCCSLVATWTEPRDSARERRPRPPT